MKKLFLSILTLGLFATSNVQAKDIIDINQDWRFIRSDVANGQMRTLNDGGWERISLPHSWNALDGQDGGSNYYRGVGWYRYSVTLPDSLMGKVIYLDCGAANQQTTIYVNGFEIRTHTGGYARFVTDITRRLSLGRKSVIAAKVSNATSIVSPPMRADFTFSGGIQRGMRILVCNPLHIAPEVTVPVGTQLAQAASIASPGVKVRQRNVSLQHADVEVVTTIRNSDTEAREASVVVRILDAENKLVAEKTAKTSVANGTDEQVSLTFAIDNPHLWNGVKDPYLYRIEVSLQSNGEETDNSTQPLGLRFYSIDRAKGFFLNGVSYPLRGIAFHDEMIDKGRASSDEDRRRDIDILAETGANYFRLSHYQHGDFTYDYLDSLGIICWTEIPVIDHMGPQNTVATFQQNASTQLLELIRQQGNHPCVCFWGLCNEIRQQSQADPVPVIQHLNDLAHSEDDTRLTTLAHDKWNDNYKEWFIPDVMAFNKYCGWYESINNVPEFATRSTDMRDHTTIPMGVSEYGAGANPWQHTIDRKKSPSSGGSFHPEEFQAYSHEEHLRVIKNSPWMWGTTVWVGFDFASDGRNEGEQPGINDKGLVSHDRQIRKDAYYLYKANWNQKEPTLYITSRRWNDRVGLTWPVRVYSNCTGYISLYVNGRRISRAKVDALKTVEFADVTMKRGENEIVVQSEWNGEAVSDTVKWICRRDENDDLDGIVAPKANNEDEASIIQTDYYSTNGIAYAEPKRGINIVHRRLDNGTVSNEKVIF